MTKQLYEYKKTPAVKEGQFLSKSAEADLVEKNRSGPPRKDFYLIGGAKRDRTADLLSARQALSQLSYSPITIKRRDIKIVLSFAEII